jgi:glycosyltransferase involved in cell wall biosynthesis/SAM-dependent methyltransferase
MTKTKPKILLLCDRPEWAFDYDAKNIAKHLSDHFTFDIRYIVDSPEIDESQYDLIWVFWWGERYHRKFVSSQHKIVKEISSHRWEVEKTYGLHTPQDAYERYMLDAGHLVVFSNNLQQAFAEVVPDLKYYQKGIDVELFRIIGKREGEFKIGWAGNINDSTKGVNEILMPSCGEEFKIAFAGGGLSRKEMVDFYNSVDVICVASVAESGPLTLLEAMSCGCFPISTDVGIARELIENGKNGLIVTRSPEAFHNAFIWCRNNLDEVRCAGVKNRKLIVEKRSASAEAMGFLKVAQEILNQNKNVVPVNTGEKMQPSKDYSAHFDRINPRGLSDSVYRSASASFRQELLGSLPDKKDAKILEIGTGHGHFLHFLVDLGYRRVFGVDLSKELMQRVRESLADRVESLEVAEALEYLQRYNDKFDCIVMLDVVEHFEESHAVGTLNAARAALVDGGTIIFRTPNMANILGNYSLYMDLTHKCGYTEWSLIQALLECNYSSAVSHIPRYSENFKKRIYSKINKSIHDFLYEINDRVKPSHYEKNIVVVATK